MQGKGFVLPLLLLLVVVIGIAGTAIYLKFKPKSSQTSNEVILQTVNSKPTPVVATSLKRTESSASADTANWKEYVSSINKFSIKYPAGWFIRDFKDSVSFENEKLTLDNALTTISYTFTVAIIDGFEGQSLKEYIDLTNKSKTAVRTDIEVDGEQGVRIADKIPKEPNVTHGIEDTIDAEVIHKGKLYEFNMVPSQRGLADSRFSQFLIIFDNMLKTFKFLD